MIRATALLVVAVFVSAPGMSIVCEIQCGMPSTEGHHAGHGGHETGADPSHRQWVDRDSSCHDALLIAPFLTTAKQSDTVMGTPATAAEAQQRAVTALALETSHAWVGHLPGDGEHPPTRRAILRV